MHVDIVGVRAYNYNEGNKAESGFLHDTATVPGWRGWVCPPTNNRISFILIAFKQKTDFE